MKLPLTKQVLWPGDAEVLGCHRSFRDSCRHCRWVVLLWSRKPGTSENAIMGAFLLSGQCFWTMGKCCWVSVTAAHLELKWRSDLQRLSGVFLPMVFTRSSDLHSCWGLYLFPTPKWEWEKLRLQWKQLLQFRVCLLFPIIKFKAIFLQKEITTISVFSHTLVCLPLLGQTLDEGPHQEKFFATSWESWRQPLQPLPNALIV